MGIPGPGVKVTARCAPGDGCGCAASGGHTKSISVDNVENE